MSTYDDIWYAARSTQIVYMPPKLLETFGESRIHYLVLSEEMDQPSAIRLRSGIVTAERPRIVTPTYFKQKSVENFGEDARKYFDEVLSKDVNARFVEYGLKFGKQEFKEELAHVLKTLTPREERVLSMRFGLTDGHPHTLEEVGKEFNVTRERIRQIEAKALRKLRHPTRSKKLRDYVE